MKLERLQEYVLPVVATLAGMGFAVYTGYLMGQGQISRVVMMLGLLFLGFLTMVMRQYIWLLLLVTWPWAGTIPALPLPFTVRDLGVLAVFTAYLTLKALKVARRKTLWGVADVVMIILLVYLVTVFIRNPVGFLTTSSYRVGGRPYINIAFACLAYFVLARVSIPIRNASKLIICLIVASNAVIAILNVIAEVSPRIGRVLLNFYTGLAVAEEADPTQILAPGEVVERHGYLGSVGSPIGLALASFYRPITVINPIYFGRFLLLLISLACIMLSGFRSMLINAVACFAIAAYLRSGWSEIVRLAGIGFFAVVFLVAGQGRLYDLPLSAQRALSFLPGAWSYAAVESAQSSSEWRFEMWRIFLRGNKYVQNQLFGDGFGLTKRDLIAIAFAKGGGASQEAMLITGGVHSGPLSTVRVIGYFGLAIYLTFLVLIARLAWRVARRAQGTPYISLALFVGLPLIYEPFNFVFIYGGFDSSVPNAIYGLGMLKMVGNTLDDHFGLKPEFASDSASSRRVADPEFALAGGSR